MVSVRSTTDNENGQEKSSLGKRPRQPLSELATNTCPKRSKPVSDSHTGTATLKKPRVVKPTSSSNFVDLTNEDNENDDDYRPGTVISEPAADEQTLEELFELDEEEQAEDDDVAARQEQEQQFDRWFRHSERDNPLASLSLREQRKRVDNCYKRLSYMLESLCKTAKSIPKDDFYGPRAGTAPMTLSWWHFFCILSCSKVVERLMTSLTSLAKLVLGGPLTTEELLLFPAKWQGCGLWAIYFDAMTKAVDSEDLATTNVVDLEALEQEIARYCGSGTAKAGVDPRLSSYTNVHAGTTQGDGTQHSIWLSREDVKPNLRVIAVFNQYTVAKPYVLLMELLMTILLQTLSKSGTSKYRRASTIEMIEKATPLDVPEIEHTALNRAAQCLQGLYHRRRKDDRICQRCGRGEEPNSRWYAANPGLPFGGLICRACTNYKASMGKDRDPELETRLNHKLALQKELGETPAKGTPCPGCLKVSDKTYWVLPVGDHAAEPERRRWECNLCYSKPTASLFTSNMDAAKVFRARRDLLKDLPKKPANGTPCPSCGKPTNSRQFCPPQGDLLSEPGRFRYECTGCYKLSGEKLEQRKRDMAKKF